MKGGIGSASATLPDRHVVGALVAVNASGDIHDPESGALVAERAIPMAAGSRRAGPGWKRPLARTAIPRRKYDHRSCCHRRAVNQVRDLQGGADGA